MDQPLVSILVANYNNGQYLEECIESIFNQTYKNWELLIIDDCSNRESKYFL
jgi:glycosyltransferase involved in cell wall biosynthesis